MSERVAAGDTSFPGVSCQATVPVAQLFSVSNCSPESKSSLSRRPPNSHSIVQLCPTDESGKPASKDGSSLACTDSLPEVIAPPLARNCCQDLHCATWGWSAFPPVFCSAQNTARHPDRYLITGEPFQRGPPGARATQQPVYLTASQPASRLDWLVSHQRCR